MRELKKILYPGWLAGVSYGFLHICSNLRGSPETLPNQETAVAEVRPDTVQLNHWVDRMRGGDRAAGDELLRAVGNRLERLARKMLGRFPDVHRWAETDDVLQNALMRLLRALEQVRPASVRDFFGLAAEQMRRELLDLARHFHGPEGSAAHHESGVLAENGEARALDPPDGTESPDELHKWSVFHQEVGNLPVEERELVGLIFYHGWKQGAVAELFGITVRTVQRRWESALLKLRSAMKDLGS
jgi:RNA polymerase sigma factor (sigma-70 family)